MGDSVATQLVGHETHRFLALTLQQFSKESPRRPPVPAGLDEEVDQVTILIHGTPQILALPVDRDQHFVQEPCIAETAVPALQPPGVIGAELRAPLANDVVRLPGTLDGEAKEFVVAVGKAAHESISSGLGTPWVPRRHTQPGEPRPTFGHSDGGPASAIVPPCDAGQG